MKTALAFFLLIPFLAWSQTQISDNFNDGDFATNPSWVGDTAFFEVNSAFELQLEDTIAGTRYLSTASGIVQNASWQFYLRMDFNPSGSNYAKVYLVSDQQDLNAALNGYFVRVGGSSNDRISLYRQTGTNINLVAESGDDWVDIDPVEVRVKVERSAGNLWSLSADTSGGTNFQLLGSAVDSNHNFSTHFGVAPQYTVTRSDKFLFDDFLLNGEVFQDTLPAELEQLEVLDSVSLSLTFSESLNPATAKNESNYNLNNGIGQPASAVLDPQDDRLVKLTFPQEFVPRIVYQLALSGLEDRFGNVTSASEEFILYKPVQGDVVINELMIDPTPVIGVPPNALPEKEYIELYNRSNLPIDLKDWILIAGNSTEILPHYLLAPGSYVVITKDEGANEFPANLPILGIDISSLALTNGGTSVSLLHTSGVVLSSLTYFDSWYNDPNKTDGGWSLEQIDPDNLCGGAQNWTASINPVGGTPGEINSVFGTNPDTTHPVLERLAISGDSSVMLFFSERLETDLVEDASNYILQPELEVSTAEALLPGLDRVELKFNEAINPQRVYRLWVYELPTDCSGNELKPDTLLFSIPAIPEKGDLLINEILFNPPSGGSDFVEIYNNSDRFFDLSKLRLGNWDAALEAPVGLEELTAESFLIGPGRYLALSTDAAFVKNQYVIENPENIVEVARLPGMSDAEGSIVITTSSLKVIDAFQYTDKMHLPILNDDEGVSLERLSFEKPTQDTDNWHSAASTVGFATPGYKNSQAFVPALSAEINLEPKVFSPNQDGHNDQLSIVYKFENPNNVVNLTVWSSAGYQIRELQDGTSVGGEGFFTWDGTDEHGQLLSSGIYIIVVDYFNAEGVREVVRKTCVLSL